MDIAALSPIIIALISTGIGGVGLKILEHVLNKGSKKTDVATDIREELRTDAKYARDELRKAEIDLDELRDKYFKLMQESLEIKSQLQEFIKYIDGLKETKKKANEIHYHIIIDMNKTVLIETEVSTATEAATAFMEMQRTSFPQPEMSSLEAEVSVFNLLDQTPPQGASVGYPGGFRLSVRPCEHHDIAFTRN